ncbi:NAD(P)H-binding protein [Companilactobacillus ginsenosidimutans]|uniref:NmrA-like domain-containing protein n=1 Tax=Companilactobacillus ginsenosidimutans TaxID=1007676 RepID=A0A0H4QGE8_9LACO|nr:NAD(P)H-binding protein [Companilactobacillus ginsenosidimutans]AKP67479.1 hypothetical protein ABM34_08025 [Companilactobacillus ginsenosidimutans]
MKFVLTGSLGHIGLPLTKQLVADGHDVTVISSNKNRAASIEQLGADAKIGNMLDEKFLTDSIKGADGVYLMMSFAHSDEQGMPNQLSKIIGATYSNAIRNSGVKNVINLSSVGADQGPEVGTLHIYQNIENAINEVEGINVTHIRPTSMYYNLLGDITTIKRADAIYANYPGDVVNSYVAPEDIAPVIAERLENPKSGVNVKYVASDEKTGAEVAQILGDTIGKKVKWIEITDEQKLQSLMNAGISEELATGITRMGAAHKLDAFYADYHKNHPTLGSTKLTDFAKEFAKIYNK